MTSLGFTTRALSVGTAAALLAGCGVLPFGSAQGRLAQDDMQPPIGAPGAMSLRAHHRKHSKTFGFTGAEQTFIVPKHVSAITITAYGASGGGDKNGVGNGGLIEARISVTSDEKLAVLVGGEGRKGYKGSSGSGGFNGGAAGGEGGYTTGSDNGGDGGGGASDVRQNGDALKNRVVIAGGGGGRGSSHAATVLENRQGAAPPGNGEVAISWQS
jgi:hypothetical protein